VNEDDVEGHWLKNGVEIQYSAEKRFNYISQEDAPSHHL